MRDVYGLWLLDILEFYGFCVFAYWDTDISEFCGDDEVNVVIKCIARACVYGYVCGKIKFEKHNFILFGCLFYQ